MVNTKKVNTGNARKARFLKPPGIGQRTTFPRGSLGENVTTPG